MSYTTTLMTEWMSETTGACTEMYSHSIPINNWTNSELINNKNNISNKEAALANFVKDFESVGNLASATKCIEFMFSKGSGPFDPLVSDNSFTLKNLLKIITCDDKTLIPTSEVCLIKTYGMGFKKIVLDGAPSWVFS